MKKSIILLILSGILIIVASVDSYADATSQAMGVIVDSDQYGIRKDYYFIEILTYAYSDPSSMLIGKSILKTAVYEDQTDDDWALVIIQTIAEPEDNSMKIGLFTRYFDSGTRNHLVHSDINSSSVTFGNYFYIHSTNFQMEQPYPMVAPQTDSYGISISLENQIKVSASVQFEINELNLYINHSIFNEIYDCNFAYSPTLFSSVYMNSLTFNVGAFLVDMTVPTYSTSGSFVNQTELTAVYSSSNFWVGTIYGSANDESLIFY